MPAGVSRPRTSAVMSSASNAHTVATVLGLAVAGVLYLAIPGALAAASVGILAPSVAPYWAVAMIVGGLTAFGGIATRKPRVEIIGLALLGAALGLATAAVFDVRDETVIPGGMVFFTHCIASIARMAAVVHIEATRTRVALEAARAVRSA